MVTLVLVMVVGILMAGCSDKYMDMLDYKSAEEFEAALNNGDTVEGTYVMVEVIKVEPNSAFGYNIQAGEHLNFVAAANPVVEQGNTVVFKVEKVASMFGSFIVTYEEHKVIEE